MSKVCATEVMEKHIEGEELRKKLTNPAGFIPYEEGEIIRKQLHETALKEYEPKHSLSKYLEFMNNNECTLAKQHPQSVNHPWCFGLFTVVSQWVYGDCVEECLDRAMSGKKDDRYFKEYMPGLKNLPVAHLIKDKG